MDELFGTYEYTSNTSGQEQGSSPFYNNHNATTAATPTTSASSHGDGRMMGDGVSSSYAALYTTTPTPTVTPTANNNNNNSMDNNPSLHLESSNHHQQQQHPPQQQQHQHYNSCSNIPTTSNNMFDLLELQQSFTDIQVTSEHHHHHHHHGPPASLHQSQSYSSPSHHHPHVTHNNNNNNNGVIHNPFDLHNASFHHDTVPTMATTPTRSSSVGQPPLTPLSSSNAWENYHHHHSDPQDAKAPTNTTDAAAFDPFDGDGESWAATSADWNDHPTQDESLFSVQVNQPPLPPTHQTNNGHDDFINDDDNEDDDDDEAWQEGNFANDSDSDESFVSSNSSSSCHSSTNKREPATTPTNHNYREKQGQQGPVVVQPIHSTTSTPTNKNNDRLITIQVEKPSLHTTSGVVIQQTHPGGDFVVAKIVPGSLLDNKGCSLGMTLVSINGIYIGKIVGLSSSQVESMIHNVKGSLVLEFLETQQQQQQQQQQPNDTQTASYTQQMQKQMQALQQQQQQRTISTGHRASSAPSPTAASVLRTPTNRAAAQPTQASVPPPIPKNSSASGPSTVGPPSTASNHGTPSSSGQPTPTSATPPPVATTTSSTATLYDSRTFPPYDSNSQRILLQYDSQDNNGMHSGTGKHNNANNLEGLQNSLSRFVKDTTTPARAWTATGVTLNGYPLNATQVQWIATQPMAFKPRDNTHYWYDAKSGFCGKIGGDWKYLLEPNLVGIKGSLHPRSSCGNSKITINGRELTTTEVQRFRHAMILLQDGCRYAVDAMGDIRLLSSNTPQPVANWRTTAQHIKTFNQVGNVVGNGGGGGGSTDGFSSEGDARMHAFAAGATWV